MGARRRPVRKWTLADAEAEFPIERHTLANRLGKANEEPDSEGLYTTKQICAVVYGDEAQAKQRKAVAEADIAEMDRDERAGLLLPADVVEGVWQDAISLMRDVVNGLEITDAAKRRLLGALRDIPLSEYQAKVEAGAEDSEG